MHLSTHFFAALLACLAPVLAVHAATVADISAAACAQMKGRGVLKSGGPVGCERLRIVRFSYLGFDGALHRDGEIMVLDAAAGQVRDLFDALLQQRFPMARARLMDHYGGGDDASMRDNNTSGFNHRATTGGGALSLHAYGLAIDINPEQNPYIAFTPDGRASVSPQGGVRYANRAARRPGKAQRVGMAEDVVRVFAWHGFPVWGGDWDNPIDYQHFQVDRALAERLTRLPADEAHAAFQSHVERHRACMRASPHRDAPCTTAP